MARDLRTSTRSTPQKRPAPRDTPKQTKSPGKPANGASSKSAGQKHQKSKYFEKEDEDSDLSEPSSTASKEDDEVSGYEDDSVAESVTESENDEDDYASDSTERPRKRRATNKKATRPNSTPAQASGKKGGELWRPGVRTGLGPGREAIIAKPKARSAGKTPYADDRIHPNTMLFLRELRENNDREWLKMHDPDYRASWQDFMSFAEQLQNKIIEIDTTVPELPLKDIVFRIYRDIRFSPDPTPYKPYFSGCWSRTGRKGPFAVYYVQIKPGGDSLVGGGLWMPEAAALAALREDIDKKPHKIKAVLTDASVRRHFLDGISNDAKKATKAFAKHNSGNALKTKPKGFNADHPEIELLRLRNYTIGKTLSDEEVVGPGAISRICELVQSLLPFITYLNSVVQPDEAENSSDEDSDEEAANSQSGEEDDDEAGQG